MNTTITFSIDQLALIEQLVKDKSKKLDQSEDALGFYKGMYKEILGLVRTKLYVIQEEPVKEFKKEYLKPRLESKKVTDTPIVKQHAFEAMSASW